MPIFIIALAIWLEDRDPILFKQKRVGRQNQTFLIYKFRTMVNDCGRFQGDLIGSSLNESEREKFQTTAINDTRVTKVGRFIRPSHLDELPQLFNVIRGEMSLVGVRPDVPIQQFDYPSEIWQTRHQLKPGITGLAQINGSINSLELRTELDLFWVNNYNIQLYFTILFHTLWKVIKRNSN